MNVGCPGMSQRGPMYPIAELSIAENATIPNEVRSALQPGLRLHSSGHLRRTSFCRLVTHASDHTMPFTLLSDDELIAQLLIHTWTLTTGKTLRGDVPPHELTEAELIDFWSDDCFD